MARGSMQAELGKSSIAVSIGIALLSAIAVLVVYSTNPSFLRELDLRLGDNRFILRGTAEPNPEVAVIAIDEESINALGRWPWSRATIARLIDAIEGHEPRALALDIVFSEPQSPEQDSALGESIERGGNVVLGFFFREGANKGQKEESLAQLTRSSIEINVGGLKDTPPGFPSVELNLPEIGRGARGFGFFNFPTTDSDGILRHAQLVMAYEGRNYPSLSIEALSKFMRKQIAIRSKPLYGMEGLAIGDVFIPTNEKGEFIVNYYGPGDTLTTYSAADILKGRVPEDALIDKLVFVGATELGIYDVWSTPFDPFHPGVEIHATIAANALDGKFLVENKLTRALDYLLILALPILCVLLLALAQNTLIGIALWLLLLSLHALLNYFLFSYLNMVASPLYPALSLSLAFISFEGWRNLLVERKSRYLKKAFSSYISPELVSRIIEEPERLALGGESRVVSILFSDIRDFTTISERLEPRELVRLLNEYLGPMTEIVIREHGMLDKYIGDAIMAIFGAPLELPDHAQRACISSLKMTKELRALNNKWQKEGWPTVEAGIGISTGEVIVGNMGTDVRFDYTAIGDEVNLAARLEGLNKFYGTEIIVSQSTFEHIEREGFVLRELDLVAVKGKATPTPIYELMDFNVPHSPKRRIAEEFKCALEIYRKRNFAEAREAFSSILNSHPGDGPSAIYIKRCEEYIVHPPHDRWEGVYEVPTK